MKKILIMLAIIVIGCASAKAMNFEEAYSQMDKKPMLVLVYAQWAENYSNAVAQFRNLQSTFGNSFNYVELDIASKQTKKFNAIYHIYPNLPYVLMFREGGKITRYIPRECAMSESCMTPKIKSFMR